MIRSMKTSMRIPLAVCLILSMTSAWTAGSDRNVMGIELGSRLALPDCGAGSGTMTSKLCVNGSMSNRKPWGADEHYVAMPRAGVPPYVRGELKVATVQGIVESIQVGTWGLQSQSGAIAALTEKYGKPTRTQKLKKSPHSRITPEIDEWDLGDYSVRLDGSTGSIDWGLIEVSSVRYQTLVKDYEKRQPAR
jgi:hypothetical protein